jgi:peroxiredoxin
MGKRMGRIGRICTDFFGAMHDFQAKNQQKIRANPLNPPHPFFHSIGIPKSEIRNPHSEILLIFLMKKGIQKMVLIVAAFSILLATTSFTPNKKSIIEDFSLKNVNGLFVSTKDFKKAKGFIVIFTCNHCPFAKLYGARLNALNAKYKKLKVPLLAINSMDSLVYEDESFDKMRQKAQIEQFNFPYLQDASQIVGKNFGAEHTPAAYVIWKEQRQWIVKYAGAIDDNGENPTLATPYIAQAVDELLKNKPVSNPTTPSFGCRIFYRKE